MTKATINGWELDYTVTGDGPPLLFIHGGFGGVAGRLMPQPGMIAQAIGDGFSLIQYSRRNCGLSEMREASYTQDDIADEAAALLTHLGHDKAIICGDSMGGTIAQSFALRHPEQINALALIETSAHMSDAPFYQPLKGLMTVAALHGADALFEKRRGAIYGPPAPNYDAFPAERREAMRAMADGLRVKLPEAPEELVRSCALGELCNWRAHASYDTRPQLVEIGRFAPLVLHGDSDTTVPTPHGEDLARDIPGASLALIPGGNHGILAWPAARTALRSWLDSVS